jgi:hypothetical protein
VRNLTATEVSARNADHIRLRSPLQDDPAVRAWINALHRILWPGTEFVLERDTAFANSCLMLNRIQGRNPFGLPLLHRLLLSI